jgi:hypothetical protein
MVFWAKSQMYPFGPVNNTYGLIKYGPSDRKGTVCDHERLFVPQPSSLVRERERERQIQMENSESSASLRWKILRRSLRPPSSSSGIYEIVHYRFTTLAFWCFELTAQIAIST